MKAGYRKSKASSPVHRLSISVRFLSGDKVIFGATVDILNIDTDETVTYQIVGDDEADVKSNKISINSPIVGS